jgi:hypothetical protein
MGYSQEKKMAASMLRQYLQFPAMFLGGGVQLDLPLSVHLSVLFFVSHVSQKVIDLQSGNLTGMLISMCSCSPGELLPLT